MLLSFRMRDNRTLDGRGQSISRMSSDQREQQLNQWARIQLADMSIEIPECYRLVPASDDASFRRYFRYEDDSRSFIFVDAPPEKEDSRPFVSISEYLLDHGLNAPEVYSVDFDLGFMMLTDLGHLQYLKVIKGVIKGRAGAEEISSLYKDAINALVKMQSISAQLPLYDASLLQTEMDLFPDWFVRNQLKLELSDREIEMLKSVNRLMIDSAIAQPQVFVHRDYHRRNLMVTSENNPGIIDFQDAVIGPVTYDLVSLLRDCYLELPPDELNYWVQNCYRLMVAQHIIEGISLDAFRRWFDFMGLQRQLKCAGIFSRLHLRDGKAGYLADIPRVVTYMVEVCSAYKELNEFGGWLGEVIVPRLSAVEFTR